MTTPVTPAVVMVNSSAVTAAHIHSISFALTLR